MADDGPPLLRPIPRRPFAFDIKSPTPPQDDDYDSEAQQREEQDLLLARFRRDLSSAGFLGAHSYSPPDSTTSLSRPQSYMNLTSSTLAGIYKPTASTHDDDNDRSELHTPWGTGAETPVKRRPSINEATYELMCDRSQPLRHRRSSYNTAESTPIQHHYSTASMVFSLSTRAALLFVLGVGYGMLVTRFHKEQGLGGPLADHGSTAESGFNRNYLAFWGASGVIIGALQPWFDKVWENVFGPEEEDAVNNGAGISSKDTEAGTDWALVMRAIGAFVGIVFAIRKLSWTSTMQLSATLALANPLLWWIIDRSTPGFVLSSGVGLTGSILLLGVNPEMIPTPSSPLSRHNSSTGPDPLLLGGLASQETVETCVWMLSVLFCSCLCFGNIGRRLSWSKSAVARGRWGGLR